MVGRMKALVLSGGAGTRLGPITHTSAKQLVPVADKPVLFEEFRRDRPDAQILLTRVADPRSFGVAELDPSGRVIGLEEEPDHPKSDLALVGVCLFTPAVHEAVRAVGPSWRGELEITHPLQRLIDSRADVRCTVVQGYWKDTGNAVGMLEVNRSVPEGVERRIDGQVDDRSETIGRHAEVTPAPGVPSAHRLVLGDHSKVQIHP